MMVSGEEEERKMEKDIMSNQTEIQKMEKAVDRIGEHMHTCMQGIMMGLAANRMLSELGMQQAEIIESLKFADLPDANKEPIRASCRVLLLDVLKDCVK